MRKSKARIRAEALALSAMMISANMLPVLADNFENEVGIEASVEDLELATPSNATPVEEEEDLDKDDIDEESGEFEEELENDLETEENTESSESDEDTESSESLKESSGDSENEGKGELSGAEESTEESSESEEETEEVDLEQVKVATPSNLEKVEEKPELMTLREVAYGEWTDSEDGNWQYMASEDGTCSIKPLSDEMKKGDVVVPEEIDGYIVTGIGDEAWGKTEYYVENMEDSITSITLPDSVITIGTSAFWGCEFLREINLSNIEFIGECAFTYCKSLTEVNLANVKSVELGTFQQCDSLKKVNIPNAETIGVAAFHYCHSLREINVAKAVSIDVAAFEYCSNLEKIDVSNTETIGDGAFHACDSLIEITQTSHIDFSYGP